MVGYALMVDPLLPWLLLPGLMCALLVAFTWGLANERRLPGWYAFYGLLFLTGSVYVMTLAGKDDPEGLWRRRTARSLKKPVNRVLLGLLVLHMAVLLAAGVPGLVWASLAGTSYVSYEVEGREVESFAEALPHVALFLYCAVVGVFHFAVTQRRVWELLGTR